MDNNNSHSIILIQFEEDVRTRTYLHYETVNEALESLNEKIIEIILLIFRSLQYL